MCCATEERRNSAQKQEETGLRFGNILELSKAFGSRSRQLIQSECLRVCVHCCESCQASSCVLKEALILRGMVQHCGNHIKGIGKLWAFYHCLHILSFTRNKQHCSAFCGTHVSRWVSLMKYLPI